MCMYSDSCFSIQRYIQESQQRGYSERALVCTCIYMYMYIHVHRHDVCIAKGGYSISVHVQGFKQPIEPMCSLLDTMYSTMFLHVHTCTCTVCIERCTINVLYRA